MPCALITGITGQDGSFLAEFLLEKGYYVVGLMRRSSAPNYERIEHIREFLDLKVADLLDLGSLIRLLEDVRPDEVYNLAAQSFVQTSFDQPALTAAVTGIGVANVLEAIRIVNPRIRFYQASSSEMFGKVCETPQTETTPFHPRSPYGVAKLYGHWITINYRESHGIFGCSGILFNHESPRRGPEFVTRKISLAAARIKLGLQTKVELGNLDARRDWGYAGDYVKAMWMMLQRDEPTDYVIATGRCNSVRDLLDTAFGHVGLDWREHVVLASQHLRPAEVDLLCGDSSKAERELEWRAELPFEDLVRGMVDADLERERRGPEHGPRTRRVAPSIRAHAEAGPVA